MKRVLIPLVLCVALVATLGAAPGYWARITAAVDSGVVHTQNADIALSRVDGNPISEQVIQYVSHGDPARNVVEVDLGKIQPGSKYDWVEVLKVTNNNDFAVNFNVEGVSGKIGGTGDNVIFEIWEGDTFLWKAGEVGRYLTDPPDDQEATHYSSRPFPTIWIGSGQSKYISFGITAGSCDGGSMQWTNSAGPEEWANGGSYSGTITFSATRNSPWAP